jgi:hypothetical protein
VSNNARSSHLYYAIQHGIKALPNKAQAGDVVQHVPQHTPRGGMRVRGSDGNIVGTVLVPKLRLQEETCSQRRSGRLLNADVACGLH